jgi:hypothetical protein
MGDLNLLTQTGLNLSAMGELELLPALFTLPPDRSFAAKDITAGNTLFDLRLLMLKECL